jgi:hypothetical protein
VKRAIAVCLRLRKHVRNYQKDRERSQVKISNQPYQPPDVDELRQAELKVKHSRIDPNEIKLLRRLKSNPTNREDVKDCKANLLTNQRSLQIGPVYG